MKIKQRYNKYRIPPNLQDHMVRTAAVGAYIAEHWIEDNKLNKTSIVQALLLHDMGNIIKFDFRFSHLLGEEEENAEYWEKVQAEFKEKYGLDEHVATIS